MDKGTQSLLNVLLSVLAPVMVLDHCSVSGPELWQLGTTAAMCVALSLPLGFGVLKQGGGYANILQHIAANKPEMLEYAA